MKLLFSLSGSRLSQSGIAALLLTIFSFLVLSVSSAQDSEDLYRGIWQIDTPDEGSLIVIVKRHGRASYFWGITPTARSIRATGPAMTTRPH